jgi:hypothetical protein
MRTLKESILDDIETTMNNGGELVKEIEKETKEFLKAIGMIKTYNRAGVKLKRSDTLRCGFFAPYTLKQLGYDGNFIKIIIREDYETDYWKMNISIYTVDEQSKMRTKDVEPVWDKTVYFGEYYNSVDIVKYLLKSASKSLDSFKKFLNNVEKYNEKVTDTNLLLK